VIEIATIAVKRVLDVGQTRFGEDRVGHADTLRTDEFAMRRSSA